MIALYGTSYLIDFLDHYIISSTSQKVSKKIRSDLSRKIDRVPLSYYDRTSTGDIMSRLTNDADTIAHSSGYSISDMISSLAMVCGALAFMLATDVVLTVVAIVPAIIGLVFIYVLVRKSHKYFLAQSRNLGNMQGLIDETYSGHDIVRAYNGEASAKERFDVINNELYYSAYKSRFISSLMPQIMNLVSNIGYLLICVVGAMLMIDPLPGTHVTYGVIVAFIIYVRQFTSPLREISDALARMQSVAASAERVFEFMDVQEMEDESGKVAFPDPVRGRVEFRDVHFSYVDGEEVIHGFSAVAEPGRKVAIVGPTGAGKTTLVNLLMRFYEVDSGDILVDGVSIRDMRREDVHRLFTMVLQDAWIFEGTVKENIIYGEDDATDEEVRSSCEAVGIDRFIERLPEGYDSVLKGGSELSAGQRQQITIARALVRKAPLLILDEATSSVDTRTERKIQDAMDRLTKGRTSFVIAHRLSTIRDSDLILVVRDGEIVEQGTHDRLLAANGFYKELYDSQFDNCE